MTGSGPLDPAVRAQVDRVVAQEVEDRVDEAVEEQVDAAVEEQVDTAVDEAVDDVHEAAGSAEGSAARATDAAQQSEQARQGAVEAGTAAVEAAQVAAPDDPLLDTAIRKIEAQVDEDNPYGVRGRPMNRRSPFRIGFAGALGVGVAYGLVQALVAVRGVLVLLLVSGFLAIGLDPAVQFLERRGVPRGRAVGVVLLAFVLFFVGFGAAVVPPIVEQGAEFVDAVPGYLTDLQANPRVAELDRRYGVIDQVQAALVDPARVGSTVFGGVLGVGKVVVGAFFSTLAVLILTLYFLANLPSIKAMAYRLVPRSRRARVGLLTDEVLTRVGGYVAGALGVALVAGTSSFVVLLVLGVPYPVALALLVGLTDLVPLVGATVGAAVIVLVAFTVGVKVGIIAAVYFFAYQQVENYVLYPRMMQRSVDVSPAVTVVAVLVGGSLLGVIGALLAIPIAAGVSCSCRRSSPPSRTRPERSVRQVVRARQRRAGRRHPRDHGVEQLLGVPHEQVLRAGEVDHLGLRHDGEALPRLRRAQEVVQLRHQRHQRLARPCPGVQVLGAGEAQRRADEQRALDRRVAAVAQRQVRAERPAQQPQVRQVLGLREVQRRGDVEALGLPRVERALARAVLAAGAPRVEAQHRQPGQGREPPGGLAQQVAVHHPALRGQRVQADQRRDRRTVQRQRQLPDQAQPVGGVQGDRPALGRQDGVRADVGHRPTLASRRSAVAGGVLAAVHLDAAPAPRRPARRVPVPPVVRAALRPGHHVRRPPGEHLVAAGAAVRAARGAAGHRAHDVPVLDPLAGRHERTGGLLPGAQPVPGGGPHRGATRAAGHPPYLRAESRKPRPVLRPR